MPSLWWFECPVDELLDHLNVAERKLSDELYQDEIGWGIYEALEERRSDVADIVTALINAGVDVSQYGYDPEDYALSK